MRVLLVGKAAPEQGGIPVLIEQLLASELATRHDLQLLNLTRSVTSPGATLSWRSVGRTVQDTARVARASRGYDVVHIHTAFAPTVIAIRAALLTLAGQRGGAVVVHVHGGLVEEWMRGPLRRGLTRIALGRARHVVAVAEGPCRALQQVLDADRVHLVDNGIDERAFVPGPARAMTGDPRVVFAGILSPRKGVLDLFAASTTLRSRGVAHELVIAGGNQEQGEQVEREVRAAAPTHAQLLGPVPREQMAHLLRGADVFCLPSWLEAMPMSVLEAMAAGLPVVSTPVGDVSRAVEHGVTGLLVPPRDRAALAEALALLVGDTAMRQRMGRAGRDRCLQHFTISRTAEELELVYTSSAEPRRSPAARRRATPGT